MTCKSEPCFNIIASEVNKEPRPPQADAFNLYIYSLIDGLRCSWALCVIWVRVSKCHDTIGIRLVHAAEEE